jgi:hypothetical protein
MTEEERMLKLLEPGAEVTIMLSQSTMQPWAFGKDSVSAICAMKAIKIVDEGSKMLIQLGLNEIRVPYDKLTCSAIETLGIIAPSELVRFSKDLDEILKQK